MSLPSAGTRAAWEGEDGISMAQVRCLGSQGCPYLIPALVGSGPTTMCVLACLPLPCLTIIQAMSPLRNTNNIFEILR